MMERRFIAKEEFAEYLGVSVETVRAWVWQRRIPYVKVGRLVRFDLKEIEAWLEDRHHHPLERS